MCQPLSSGYGNRLMAVSSVAAARAVLTVALPGVKVASQTPNPVPSQFVRIQRAGGGRSRELDQPRILVECFASTTAGAPDGPTAEQLALTAYDALQVAASAGPWASGWITGWEGNSIADYPDPDQTKHARWQFSGQLYLLT